MNVFLITFSCYGDHLPGDDRGSFDHVRNGSRRFLAPNPALHRYARTQMKQDPFRLCAEAREVVRDTIVRVCQYRSWPLRALHVRTTHLHGVVEAPSAPNVINSWKAYATRELRAQGLVTQDQRVWARTGNSTIIRPNLIETAIRYVLVNQGTPMATFPPTEQSSNTGLSPTTDPPRSREPRPLGLGSPHTLTRAPRRDTILAGEYRLCD